MIENFKKFWWILPIVIGLIIFVSIGINMMNGKTADPLETDKIVTSSPVNVDQIYSVSKFRSCEGHEYSGTDFNGESEPSSSMKTYFTPILSLSNSASKVSIYAPFDGIITRIDPMDVERGRQFTIEHKPFDGWYITFYHTNMSDNVKEGAEVKSGDFLGYAYTINGYDFDLALQRFTNQNKYHETFQNLEPLFLHMTDSVLQKFTAKGLILEDTVILKSYRISNLCPCFKKNADTGFCEQYIGGTEGDWIIMNSNSSENPYKK